MTKRAILLYVAVIGVCLSIPLSSCVSDRCKDPTNAKDPSCIAENVIADCTGSDVQAVLNNAEPIIAQHIQNGVNPDGSINYSAIESDLVQDVIKFGECAVTDVWTKFFTPGKTAVALDKPQAKPDLAKAAYDKFRVAHMSHHKLKTSGGVQ